MRHLLTDSQEDRDGYKTNRELRHCDWWCIHDDITFEWSQQALLRVQSQVQEAILTTKSGFKKPK